MKLTTAKQAVTIASEAIEACGGAGYVEDTGLPLLLRDAQVLPIWEGTTNVLSLDALRALGSDGEAFRVLKAEVTRTLESIREERLAHAAHSARRALAHAESWLTRAKKLGQDALEAGARRFSLTLGRLLELTLLLKHAQWAEIHEEDTRATASARRFAASGIDLILDLEMVDAQLLLGT
jgi:hypothetical protein